MTKQADYLPLDQFPPPMRARIEAAVAAPKPPPRYITLSDGMVEMTSRAWWEWHWARGIDPDRRRNPIPPQLRAAVIARDGYVCQLCHDLVRASDVHLDHIFPRSLGGPDTYGNLQVTHSRCNLAKGARRP